MKVSAKIPEQDAVELEIADGKIHSLRPLNGNSIECYVSPGFVDLQVNGFAGVDFSDAFLDADQAASALPAMWRTGVTSFCPTLITNTLDALARNFRVLEQARRAHHRFALSVPGYHLEGPYLSSDKAYGAHDRGLMRPPDWNEFCRLQDAAGGRIAIVTLAPELPGAIEFIARASAAGVVVAIGHTDGTPEHIHAAIRAGACLSTHLGNGCAQMIDRHRNPLWAQMASDKLSASVICDGFHLSPDLLRVIARAKGLKHCILVTDAVHVATLSAGKYSLVGREIELLPSGQVVTADRRSMAGSALSMHTAVSIFRSATECSLADALRAASGNPARLLKRGEIGTGIAAGQAANLTLFNLIDEKLHITKTLLEGELVYSA